MKRNWYFILILSITAIVVFGIAATRKHLWKQTNNVKAFYNGEEATNSTVYTSVDGDLLIWIKKGNENFGSYTILKKEQIVGLTSPNEFISFYWCYFVWTYPIPVSPIGTQAAYLTARVKFEEQSVTFTVPVREDAPRDINQIKVDF